MINKSVIVTGASKGIGAATAYLLAKNKFNVAIIYRSSDKEAKKVLTKCNNYSNCILIKADVTNDKDCKKIVKETEKKLGPINILINNAGITIDNLLIRMSENDIDDVININLNSLIKITKFALKNMMKNKFGRIISISSVVGFTGNPGQSNYCASKSGIIGFTKSLALEVASRGITVNAIAPGFISSAMTDKLTEDQREKIISNIPVNRLGTPKDVANAVVFLAKEDSSYITGNTIHVNGGLAMV